MKWTKISAIIGTTLLVTALTLKLVGYEKEIPDPDDIIIEKNFLEPEPNKPTLEIESAPNWIEAVKRWPNAQGYITDNFGRTLPLNEPEYFTTTTKGTSFDINRFIPTWPDYIELEKDLVIQSPWYGENWEPIITCTLEKGTKIYFKEDE